MKLQVDKCGDICIIKLAGDLDHFHASYLREALLDLIDQGYSKVILDMSDIAFMDSSGMSVLIFVAKRLVATGGSLSLTSCSPLTYRKLDIGGLTKVPKLLKIFPSVEEARSNISK